MSKITKLIEEIKEMKVSELNELVKAIETEFGVTAAAAVVAGPAAGPAAAAEKTITLVDAGANKVSIIKIVRDVLGLGLMEAKAFVDSAPKVVKENMPAEKAEELAKQFKDAGANVKVE